MTDGTTVTLESLQAQINQVIETLADFSRAVGARFDKIDERFDRMDKRLDRMDARFDQMDKRFDQMDARFDRLENITIRDHSSRIERLERNAGLLPE